MSILTREPPSKVKVSIRIALSSPPAYSCRAPLTACFLMNAAAAQSSLGLGLVPGFTTFANCFTAFQSPASHARSNSPAAPSEKKCSALSPSECPPPFNSRGRSSWGPALNNISRPRTLMTLLLIFLRHSAQGPATTFCHVGHLLIRQVSTV